MSYYFPFMVGSVYHFLRQPCVHFKMISKGEELFYRDTPVDKPRAAAVAEEQSLWSAEQKKVHVCEKSEINCRTCDDFSPKM